MKIKTQFLILVAGIVLIPTLIFGTMLLLAYYRSPDRVFTPGVKDIVLNIDVPVDSKQLHHIERFIQNLPPNVQCAVLDENGKVVFSGMPEIKSGDILKDGDVMNLVRNSNKHYLYQIDLNFGADNKSKEPLSEESKKRALVLLTRVARDVAKRPNLFLDIFFAMLSVFAVVLIFTAVLLIWIARSVTQSVTLLEDATRRLAAGDLDTEIVVTGSNEITSLSDSLNRMRVALKDQMLRRSRFIMGLSHDLRTPIALIKGYSEAIKDGMADDPVMLEKSLNIIGTKIDQLENLINSLIDSVRLESSEWKGKLAPCALSSFLTAYAERTVADGNLLHKKIDTVISIPETVTLQVDEEMLSRLLDNIVGNAFRYTNDDGYIKFSAIYSADSHLKEPYSGNVYITISDNGCGIEEKDIPYIFDSFYRGTNSRREEGYGFGLSAVKHIADSYGWKVQVNSTVGIGSLFTITIPVQL